LRGLSASFRRHLLVPKPRYPQQVRSLPPRRRSTSRRSRCNRPNQQRQSKPRIQLQQHGQVLLSRHPLRGQRQQRARERLGGLNRKRRRPMLLEPQAQGPPLHPGRLPLSSRTRWASQPPIRELRRAIQVSLGIQVRWAIKLRRDIRVRPVTQEVVLPAARRPVPLAQVRLSQAPEPRARAGALRR
jgi:hypothetical protein